MGVFLNQLPPTEVARLKAELAEALIGNFCYPRFYDYRANALRSRPVDRAKRQEVWQYLNAVDFNVWGRVDVDSPDFQRQVERLFIHFVQRNRSFFGQQGRKRMSDVRTLITASSTTLAEGMRGHLRGQQANPPFGTPRPSISWAGPKGSRQADLPWEQIAPGVMQLQQQLQEVRGEARTSSGPMPAASQNPGTAERSNGIPSRRAARIASPATTTNGAVSQSNGLHQDDAPAWPKGPIKSGELRPSIPPFPPAAKDGSSRPGFPPFQNTPDAAPTMPLPLGKTEDAQAPEVPAAIPTRSRRGRMGDSTPSAAVSGPMSRKLSQPLPTATAARPPQSATPAMPGMEMTVKQAEGTAVMAGDEDVVIFEQLRYQLTLWLRVEAVRSGIELSGHSAFQLVEALRHQEGIDLPRLQVASTLLNMCDQIITSGRATLFDYKQAMMFYLMHTRRSN